MGFWSDIRADRDKCTICGSLLYKYGTRGETMMLPISLEDSTCMRTEFIPVECEVCSHVNPITYIVTGEDWTNEDSRELCRKIHRLNISKDKGDVGRRGDNSE